ncbi:MAG: hypothetical protein ACPGZP_08740 [Panacagrimonas sp.]
MIARRAKPCLTLIAVFAWMAQLAMPVVHAAQMTQGSGGIAAWCGPNSSALKAEIAKLPAPLQDILLQDVAANPDHQQCAQFCASALNLALPAPPAKTVDATLLSLAHTGDAPNMLGENRLHQPPARGPPGAG